MMTCYTIYAEGKKMVFEGVEDYYRWRDLEAEHRRLTILGIDHDRTEQERIEMNGMRHHRLHEQGQEQAQGSMQ